MSRRSNHCNRFWSVLFSISEGSATGLGTFDNIRHKFGFSAGVSFGFIGFVIRTATAFFFQGRVIEKADENDRQIQGYQSYEEIPFPHHEIMVESPQKKCSSKFAIPFVLIDAGLNFSDHCFTWRQLSQLFFELPSIAFWLLLVVSFTMQQLYYMTHEGYEATEQITESEPFYMGLFGGVAKEHTTARRVFLQLGALHHSIFEFAPWFVSFPQIIQFMCANPLAAGIPIGIFLLALTLLVNYQTKLFEGQHAEEHLAQDQKYIQPVTMSNWTKKIVEKTIFLMAPFHGAIIAMPNYIVPSQQISPIAGTWGIVTFFAGTVGNYKSEVKEAKQHLKQLNKDDSMMLLTINNGPTLG